MAALGFAIKVTIVIPLIAAFLTVLFCGRIREVFRKKAWIFLVFAALGYGMISWWAGGYEITQIAKETSEPIINWIALGMKGDGSWAANKGYGLSVLPTRAEKIEYARTYIWENRHEFVNPVHLLQKLRCNFASGSLGTKDYAYRAMKSNNLIWEANNRQLYNQSPMILLGCVLNARTIITYLTERGKAVGKEAECVAIVKDFQCRT